MNNEEHDNDMPPELEAELAERPTFKPSADAWAAQRDANLSAQQVDKLEADNARLHARVLTLTDALHRLRALVQKPLTPVQLQKQVEQVVDEAVRE